MMAKNHNCLYRNDVSVAPLHDTTFLPFLGLPCAMFALTWLTVGPLEIIELILHSFVVSDVQLLCTHLHVDAAQDDRRAGRMRMRACCLDIG